MSLFRPVQGALLLVLFAAAVHGQTASLVRDLNTVFFSTSAPPTVLHVAGGKIFMLGGPGTAVESVDIDAAYDERAHDFFRGTLYFRGCNGTALNGKHWVFYGALSSVEYTLTVTDTQTGVQRIYTNPSGELGSVADTGAF